MSGVLSVFGANLRLLATERGTISGAARELGISRVQFNRFLKAESFPKPNQLKAICDYFGVDARIMTEPLEVLRQPAYWEAPYYQALKFARAEEYAPPSQQKIADGLYGLWRNSMAIESKITFSIVQLKTIKGARVARGYDAKELYKTAGTLNSRVREFRGVMHDQSEGMTIVFRHAPPVQWVSMSFLVENRTANDGSYSGLMCIARPDYAGSRRVSRTHWAPIEPTCSAILAAGRMKSWWDPEEVPWPIRQTLQRPI